MPYFQYFAVMQTLINILKEIVFSEETFIWIIKELHSNVELFFRVLESAKIGHLLVFMGFPGGFMRC